MLFASFILALGLIAKACSQSEPAPLLLIGLLAAAACAEQGEPFQMNMSDRFTSMQQQTLCKQQQWGVTNNHKAVESASFDWSHQSHL